MRYCPACRAEYAPGTERCHDCEVELVDALEEVSVDENFPPPESLVTVAAFDSLVGASILASRLEAEGIQCFIADAETVAMQPLLAGAVGGVKVQVRVSEGTRAAAIARASERPSAPACPACGSAGSRRKGLSFLVALLVVLSFGVLALFLRPRWKCTSCAREWL